VGASLLANAVGQATSLMAGPAPSRAGSLPQFLACVNTDFVNTRDPCGSQPAGECSGSGNIFIAWAGPIASRLAPTVFGLCEYRLCEHQRSLVGASLLANVVGQATSLLARIAPSRASPLPQFLACVNTGFVNTRDPLWEPACWRMRSIRQHLYCLGRPLREQARSHSFWPV